MMDYLSIENGDMDLRREMRSFYALPLVLAMVVGGVLVLDHKYHGFSIY